MSNVPPMATAVTIDDRVTPVASAPRARSPARTANQTSGGIHNADRMLNVAIPNIEPPMSQAYARSGGIDRRRDPSGTARAAIINATRATSTGSTRKLTSA